MSDEKPSRVPTSLAALAAAAAGRREVGIGVAAAGTAYMAAKAYFAAEKAGKDSRAAKIEAAKTAAPLAVILSAPGVQSIAQRLATSNETTAKRTLAAMNRVAKSEFFLRDALYKRYLYNKGDALIFRGVAAAAGVVVKGAPVLALGTAVYQGVRGYQKGGFAAGALAAADSLAFGLPSDAIAAGRAVKARMAAARSAEARPETPSPRQFARASAEQGGRGEVRAHSRQTRHGRVQVAGYRPKETRHG